MSEIVCALKLITNLTQGRKAGMIVPKLAAITEALKQFEAVDYVVTTHHTSTKTRVRMRVK